MEETTERPRGCAVHPGHCGDLLVLELHQRLLLVGLPRQASQDCAWAATRMRHLRAELCPAAHPEDPPKDPHGRAAVRLPPVRQGLCDKERLESAQPRPHGRQAASLRPVRFPVQLSVGREEARGGRAHKGVPPHVRAVWERVYQAVLSEGTRGKAARESGRAGVAGGVPRLVWDRTGCPQNGVCLKWCGPTMAVASKQGATATPDLSEISCKQSRGGGKKYCSPISRIVLTPL